MKVLLTGGGTGGHLYPLLAVVQNLRKIKKEEVKFLFIGPANKFSKRILEENGVEVRGIFSAKIRRYWSWQNILDIFLFPLGFLQSLWWVLLFMPNVCFAKGGYGSVAPTIVCRLYFIPILIHESDAIPGLASRILAKIADKVALCFKEAGNYFKEKKIIFTGNPIREELLGGSVEEGEKFFQVQKQSNVILIIGGSQGSQLINTRILEVLPQLLAGGYQIIHQVGEGNLQGVKEEAGRQGVKVGHSDYHPYEFLDKELALAYSVADLVIARAGATVITELAALKKPVILVPLSSGANDHQLKNAFFVAEKGGALVMEENNFRGDLLIRKVVDICSDQELRLTMGENIAQFYNPDASKIIGNTLLYLAHEIDKVEGRGLFEK